MGANDKDQVLIKLPGYKSINIIITESNTYNEFTGKDTSFMDLCFLSSDEFLWKLFQYIYFL